MSNEANIRSRIEQASIPEPNSGCWLWLQKTSKGYGYLRINGKNTIASRASYKAFRGDISDKDVCHKCDNPLCVNPDHLFLGYATENMTDMMRKGRSGRTITTEQVVSIRAATGTHQTIADTFGTTRRTVGKIKSGKLRKFG